MVVMEPCFKNWAQYLLTMKYLSEMTNEQTLVMYSGHPMGLFLPTQKRHGSGYQWHDDSQSFLKGRLE